ncbi:CHAT domain-containing protein [Gymnopilus junonius]|uniref:CHAT domain-containing protein n=1 Tax=Gymnopilus junonius TaxID=109634 RepID=A0A9P5NNL9_GYMJU|nr:CHAT domain-containing protein [Gymnopilus junonius]
MAVPDGTITSSLTLDNSTSMVDVQSKIYLEDIFIEFTVEDSSTAVPSILNIRTFNDGDVENSVALERVAPNKWRYDDVIEVAGDLTFVVTWDENQNSGQVNLTQAEFVEALNNSEGHSSIIREISKAFSLKLSCNVLSLPLEEEIASQEGVQEDEDDGLATQLAEDPDRILAIALELPDDTEDNVKAHLLNLCGDQFFQRFRETRSESDINTSIRAYDLAIQLMPTEDPTTSDFQYNAAGAYGERFTLTGDLSDLETATSKFKISVDGTSDDNPTLPARLNTLSNYYQLRYNRTENPSDISEAISSQLRAIELTLDGHPAQIKRLTNLGVYYRTRFDIAGDLSDINEAIAPQEKALELISFRHPDRPIILSNLADSYTSRFDHTGDLADVSKALAYLHECRDLTQEGDVDMPARQSSLGNTYQARFSQTGNLSDISDAIDAQKKAIQLTPLGHEDMSMRLNNLGISFQKKFEHTGDLADILEAISLQQKAVDLTPNTHTTIPHMLNNLGISYRSLFNRTGALTDISKAISLLKESIQRTPEDSIGLPRMLNNVGSSQTARFRHTGDLADISEAIRSQQKAVELAPDGHTEKPDMLSNLSGSLLARFQRTGDMSDLGEAVFAQQEAIRLTPIGRIGIPRMLSNLGTLYETRFERIGELKDISEAITSHQKAVKLTPSGDADLARRLAGLGSAYDVQFNRTGDLKDISEAISYFQKAVLLTPDDHIELPNRLSALGTLYRQRFDHAGDVADISEAIAYQQQAVDRTPDGHALMPWFLNNFGTSYLARFEHSGDANDISAAITHFQNSTQLTPEGDANMPVRLTNLANAYLVRFKHTGDLMEIDQVVLYHQKAIDLTAENDAAMPIRFNNIGVAHQARFGHTEDLADIAKAISAQEKAVDLSPEGHFHMPIILGNLGLSYASRFQFTHDSSDGLAAAAKHRLAATYPMGTPSIKLIAAKRWAEIANDIDRQHLLDAYTTAINLMSQVVGLDQTIQKRHTNLPDISDVSTSAAAAAFELGKVDTALEVLEEGRCLVWNQLNNLRTPMDALRAEDPVLADGLVRVSTALEFAGSRLETGLPIPGTGLAQKMLVQDQVTAHVKLAEEWQTLLTRVRKIPNFQDFLRPPTCSTMMRRLPESGIVVLINVHQQRCDALGLVSGSDKPVAIPLPDFSYRKAEALRINLRAHLRASGVRVRGAQPITRGLRLDHKRGIRAILAQLWLQLVKPILDGLGYSEPSTEPLRIWWCATGPLAFLPIHAAGIYGGPNTTIPSVLSDFAISSYTPTLRALIDKASKLATIGRQREGLFMISQPNTPNLPPIPETKVEIQAIQRLMKGCNFPVLCLEGAAATVDQVIINMETHTSIHFACHANQDTSEPLKSGFALQDGHLELSTIIQKRLGAADLAFLSACQTSTGDEKLSEEAVHLAAGMLAAGYRGVVATMWSIQDKYGPEIAEDFYAKLTEDKAGLKGEKACLALHYATGQLRKRLVESEIDVESSLLAWVPYVHFGL